MRVCPAGPPVKAHALVVAAGFQHPALAVAPTETGRRRAGARASLFGECAMNSNTEDGTVQRRVSPLLVLGIILVPIGFALELLRDGYSKTARIFGFGWCAIWMIWYLVEIVPTLVRVLNTPAAQHVSRPAVEQKSIPAPIKVAVKAVDPEKIKYLEAIEREIKERERTPSMTLIETDDKAGVTAAMLTLGLWGKLYTDGNYLELSPAEEARRQLFRKLAERAQAEAFPKVRAMQARVWRNGMWEHDVDVQGSGPRNTHLRLRGGVFFGLLPVWRTPR